MMRSPWMDDELALLADEAAKFVARELVPHAERWETERVVDRDAWRLAGAAGLLCASIPAEYGGGGGTLAHEAVIAQEVVRAGLAGPSGTQACAAGSGRRGPRRRGRRARLRRRA